jgi:pimeloyl-ACP methyl ester carboxylesterase
MPYATRHGVRIYYETHGEGPPIALQTGGGGDLRMWQMAGYVEGLTGFRLVLIDHRGHGKSDRPRAVSDYRIEEYRDDVITVLNDVGVDRVTFLGYSHGAQVGCALAASHPERVSGLIDLDGLGPEDLSSPSRRASSLALADAVRSTGMKSKVRDWAREEGYSGPKWLLENLAQTDDEIFELLLQGQCSWNGPASILPRLGVPVLSFWAGSRGPHEVARFRTLIPSARTRIIPNVGHLGIFVRAGLLLPQIRSFATGARSTARGAGA